MQTKTVRGKKLTLLNVGTCKLNVGIDFIAD